MIDTTLLCLSVLCILATAMPFVASKKWWVKVFDFPLLQISAVTFVAIIWWCFSIDFSSVTDITLFIFLIAAFAYQCNVMVPYTPLHKKRIVDADVKNPGDCLKVVAANVYQDNRDIDAFLRMLKNANPDVVVLLETDNWWNDQLQVLKKEYPHRVEHPLENYYGMILLSKFSLKDTEVKFLIDDDIPSIHGSVQLKNGTWVKLYCLHPMPPSPTENEKSLDRDAELLMIAKKITEKEYPVIVIGDLNDVAWSHTTRLFQRISRLLDPRIGRGFYNTFHTKYPVFRWPLDHLFVSKDFKMGDLKRLQPFGSDHFAVFAELYYKVHVAENETPDRASKSDKKEAKETIRKGVEEGGNDK